MANVAAAHASVPQGKLKILNIADIDPGERFRVDYGNIEDLVESIKDKGIIQPITVSTKLLLLAGGRRYQAAQQAGLTKIPALIRESDDVDSREIELIENVFRKDFTWQEEAALVAEIDRLYKSKNYDWSARKTAQLLDKNRMAVNRSLKLAKAITLMPELAEYKTADEVFKMIDKLEEKQIVHQMRENQKADMQSPTSAKGDLNRMLKIADGNYNVGDTFAGLAALRNNHPSCAIIECDPPYAIDLADQKRSKDNVASNVHGYKEIGKEEYPEWLKKLTKELYRVAAEHSWLVFWFGPSWWSEVFSALKDAGWKVDEIPCIWAKDTGQTMQPQTYLGRAYEPFFMCRKGSPALMKPGRLNVFNYAGVAGSKKYHPTQRPLELIEEILETLGTPTSCVMVPFLGSGATLRAAYNLGMKGFGWDADDKYKDKFMLAVEEDVRALDAE